MPGRIARAVAAAVDLLVVAGIFAAMATIVAAALIWSLVVIPVALVAALAWKACRGARARLAARAEVAP
jgi:hypothetical protein